MPEEASREDERNNMVRSQLEARGVSDKALLAAMRTVPRHLFVPRQDRVFAYDDRALGIGFGQTISQPYMVGLMCELLQARAGHRVLEVGAGSGYQAAVLGQLCERVDAVEIVPELVDRARETIAELGYDNVHVHPGDGTLGYPERAPFDRIIVAAAAPELPPPLLEQLVDGGRLVAPVGDRGTQTVTIATKRGDKVETQVSTLCVFVPLRGEHGWPER